METRNMADLSIPIPPVPLKTPQEARDMARAYKGFADHLREQGLLAEARLHERQSQWWLAYAAVLAQTPGEGSD
jgi:hypothetical protein